MPRRKIPLAEKFWKRVRKTDGCWLWQGARFQSTGYGMVNFDQQPMGAHRASWLIHYGSIPPELSVLHRCDVKLCVNPSHLFLGTHRDNMMDMQRKGRAASGTNNGAHLYPDRRARGARHGSQTHPERVVRGEQQHDAKLTAQDVREIRLLAQDGESQTAMAKRFGVTQAAISCVVLRKTWRHV